MPAAGAAGSTRDAAEPVRARTATRVVAGAALLLLVAAAVAAGGPVFVAVVAAAAAVGAWEYAGLAARLGARPPLALLLALTVWLAVRYAVPGAAGVSALDIAVGAAVVAGLLALVLAGQDWRGWMAALGGALWLGWCLGFFVALMDWRAGDHARGVATVAVVVAAVVVCDTAAYAAGSAAGRHPFFARLSPRKTVEGAAAGLAGAIVAATILSPVLLGLAAWQGAVLGLATGVAAQGGDLAESALKRQAGVKDASSLIPGHGGLLDRLDSLLLVAPAAFWLYHLFSLR